MTFLCAPAIPDMPAYFQLEPTPQSTFPLRIGVFMRTAKLIMVLETVTVTLNTVTMTVATITVTVTFMKWQ